jgi:predicted dehydrogenase
MTGAGGPVGVAVVGCGTISDEYLRNMTSFPDLNVVFCADIDVDRAKTKAAEYGVPDVGNTAQALDHPDVEIVVNLTVPAAHAEVSAMAIAAGKHVWVEKPLALDTATGRALLEQAAEAGMRVGCAPDTLLGAGLQTSRRIIESGRIGAPQTALALFQVPGPERWHPAPQFLFQVGGGPLFDMGPYYLTTLASLLGPAHSVAAVAGRSRDQRVVGRGPQAGTTFDVEVPTHVSALISYVGGQSATIVLSFDSPLRRNGFIEVTGTEATLSLPDPNRFDGDVKSQTADDEDWTVTPASGATAGRGLGVLDLARSLRAGQPHRATGELALHVLDIMESIARSAQAGTFEPVRSTFTVPATLPAGWDPTAPTLT